MGIINKDKISWRIFHVKCMFSLCEIRLRRHFSAFCEDVAQFLEKPPKKSPRGAARAYLRKNTPQKFGRRAARADFC